MKMMKGMTVALVGMMAVGAIAEANTAATNANSATMATKKKIQKKTTSRKATVTHKQTNDRLATPQSSAIAAASATTSMPALTAGVSAVDSPKMMKKKSFVDNIRAGIQFEYYGGSIADPFSGFQTDKDNGYSQGSASHELDTRATLGYALSSNLTLSANAYFWTYSETTDGPGETFGFRPADSYLKLGVGKFYQSGKFKWNGDFRVYAGVGSAYPNRVAYYRTGQNLSYAISPRLTLAAYNTIRYYQNNSNAYTDARNEDGSLKTGNKVDAIVTIGPAIEYQMTDTAGISLSFNDAYAHTHQNNTVAPAEYYKGSAWGSYFELGASIDILKSLNLNPYLDMYTHTFNIEAMQLGANLNFTIL